MVENYRKVKNPVLPHGASSKKKPFSLLAILSKIPMAIHPRSSPPSAVALLRRTGARGILAFSRKSSANFGPRHLSAKILAAASMSSGEKTKRDFFSPGNPDP
jgi:hypothetical protein